jgi:UDP-N-acetylmuramate--alanine ligase
MNQEAKENFHFVGIGGAGMSGVAHICLAHGHSVSGSDLKSSINTDRLEKNGARINFPHNSLHVREDSVIVVSSAIPETNVEVSFARELGLPIRKRAEVLGSFMEERFGISVAGCHGKTTTTTLVSSILTVAGEDPSTVVGGEASHVGGNAKFGRGKYLVAEADESDGSFLLLPSRVSIVTNIDNDHLDHYGSFAAIEEAFSDFVSNTSGFSVVCGEDPVLRKMKKADPTGLYDYGFSDSHDFQIRDVSFDGTYSCFSVYRHKELLVRVAMKIPGRHNILNATAAIALCHLLGIQPEFLKKGVEEFQGVQRRFELVRDEEGVLVYDDYAHHPTEVSATLSAALEVAQKRNGKLVVCFQPHRYSRVQALLQDFKDCFEGVDFLYLLPIFAAGETQIPGVSSWALNRSLSLNSERIQVLSPGPMEDYGSLIGQELSPGDVVITVGAGDVTRLGAYLDLSASKV